MLREITPLNTRNLISYYEKSRGLIRDLRSGAETVDRGTVMAVGRNSPIRAGVGQRGDQPKGTTPPQPSGAEYLTSPPTIVCTTSVAGMSSSGMVMMSRERTTMSASLPGVSEPFRCSSKAA